MKKRLVIIDIDSICRLFADYVGEVGFPDDAQPVKLMLNPAEKRLAVVVEAESLPSGMSTEYISFDIKRFFSIGGGGTNGGE